MNDMRIHYIERTSVFTAMCGARATERNEDGTVNTCHFVPDGGQVVAAEGVHCPECLALAGVEVLAPTYPVAYEHLDGPSHYPGIPARQWVVTLKSGRQLLVRFTDSSETAIEVAQRSNEYATWSIALPGVPS